MNTMFSQLKTNIFGRKLVHHHRSFRIRDGEINPWSPQACSQCPIKKPSKCKMIVKFNMTLDEEETYYYRKRILLYFALFGRYKQFLQSQSFCL